MGTCPRLPLPSKWESRTESYIIILVTFCSILFTMFQISFTSLPPATHNPNLGGCWHVSHHFGILDFGLKLTSWVCSHFVPFYSPCSEFRSPILLQLHEIQIWILQTCIPFPSPPFRISNWNSRNIWVTFWSILFNSPPASKRNPIVTWTMNGSVIMAKYSSPPSVIHYFQSVFQQVVSYSI